MKTHTKIIAVTIIVMVIVIAFQAHLLTRASTLDITFPQTQCPDIRDEILAMNEKELNGVMFTVAEALTNHSMEENKEQFEAEFTAYANREALTHMNDVLGVLTKSIGSMPTSTNVVE